MTIQFANFKKCALLEDTAFAPYFDYPVIIIDNSILIVDGEVTDDFDMEYYKSIFEITETVECE